MNKPIEQAALAVTLDTPEFWALLWDWHKVAGGVYDQDPKNAIVAHIDAHTAAVAAKAVAAKQAEIDCLMLEYCPGEMTADQMAEWEAHQRKVVGGDIPKTTVTTKRYKLGDASAPQQHAQPLPKWIDDAKGKDPFTDDLIAHIESCNHSFELTMAELKKVRSQQHAQAAQGWGYAMVHKTGGDRGFSWKADDPLFSADWQRVALAPAVGNAQVALSDEQIVAICERECGWLAGSKDSELVKFARAIITSSQQPAAAPFVHAPYGFEINEYGDSVPAATPAIQQEGAALDADLQTMLTVFDMGLGFALCHRDFSETRNAVKKLQLDFTEIRAALASQASKGAGVADDRREMIDALIDGVDGRFRTALDSAYAPGSDAAKVARKRFYAATGALKRTVAIALAAPSPAQAQPVEGKPFAFVIVNENGAPEFVTSTHDEAQVHINDAIQEHDIDGAGKWRSIPAFDMRPDDDKLWDQTLRERDYNAEIADKLADAIGEHLGRDVGEHSSGHCPWLAALEMLNEEQPVADPMDWPLPCDVTVGNGTHKKGVPLRSLVARMKVLHGMAKLQPVADAALSQAAQDVLAERQRQVDAEGMERRYDDKYQHNELRRAAAVYACPSVIARDTAIWPWAQNWMKFTTPRRNAIKAAALLIAEIERIDRAVAAKPAEGV